jgi:inosine/xanthosine triphosphate pyrophosphatase family protein
LGYPVNHMKIDMDEIQSLDLKEIVAHKVQQAYQKVKKPVIVEKELKIFEARLGGRIAKKPAGDGGYGWDRIFIPDGYKVTRASLKKEDDRKTYLQFKPFGKLKKFLESK